jgi:hypothetical protein
MNQLTCDRIGDSDTKVADAGIKCAQAMDDDLQSKAINGYQGAPGIDWLDGDSCPVPTSIGGMG